MSRHRRQRVRRRRQRRERLACLLRKARAAVTAHIRAELGLHLSGSLAPRIDRAVVASAVNDFLASLKDAPPPVTESEVTYDPDTMRLTVVVREPLFIRDEDLCR